MSIQVHVKVYGLGTVEPVVLLGNKADPFFPAFSPLCFACACFLPSFSFIAAFMMASKNLCDDTYSNKSWCVVAQSMFPLSEINQMVSPSSPHPPLQPKTPPARSPPFPPVSLC